MSPSLPPSEQVIPVLSVVTTDNVQACDEHCFGFGNMLRLAWNVHGFGGFLHLPRNGPDKLTTCFVLVDMKDCSTFLVFKLIQFYINYNKMIN